MADDDRPDEFTIEALFDPHLLRRFRRWLRFDLSSLVLIGSNLLVVALAVRERWSLRDVMWIYWGQSVIVGVSNFLRILALKQFSTKGVRLNDRPVDPTPATKVEAAVFFLGHYGFFHAIYAVALLSELGLPLKQLSLVGLCLATFGANHAFSLVYNWRRDRTRRPNIGTVMMFPYARIIPMHLTIVFGVLMVKSVAATAFFLLLKTLADLIMHAVEHAEGAETEPEPTEVTWS